MLLTQTSLTPILSTLTILLFTLLLFTSGYVLQQRTVASLQSAIRPRLEALKDLPQARSPAKTTVGVEWEDASAALRVHVDEEQAVGENVEGEVFEYLEDLVETVQGRVDGVKQQGKGDKEEEDESRRRMRETEGVEGTRKEREGTGRRGKLKSLDEWKYSDESGGQKRMREGFAVVGRGDRT